MNGIMYPYDFFPIIHSIYFISKMKVFANELLIPF